LENGGGRHKKSEKEVNDLIEKVLRVQELNAQALASHGQIQIPDSDGSESAVESGGDDEGTQERGSSKPSAEGGSLVPSTTITTGDESNQYNDVSSLDDLGFATCSRQMCCRWT
jgi:hypothetical protein